MSLAALRRERLPAPSDRYQVGRGAVSLSPLWLGVTSNRRTVCAAFDAGINAFFVSADMHWPLYEETRLGLEMLLRRGSWVRDEIVVGVASYVTPPAFCHAPFSEVLDAVPRLKRIDASIAGGIYGHELAIRLEQYRHPERRQNIRSPLFGASFHDCGTARAAIEASLVDVAFTRYNPLHPGADGDLFPRLPRNRRTLLYTFRSTDGYVSAAAMRRLPRHLWRPHVTDYYRFALTAARVDGLLVSLASPRQVRQLVDALEKGPLDEDERRYLMRLAKAGSVGARRDRGA